MPKSLLSGWRAFAGPLLSAALFGLYARGGNAYLLGFVALVPWLLASNAPRSIAGAMGSGLLMSVAFVAAVFGWFGFAIGTFTGIGPVLGLLVALVAAPLLQPQILAFAVVRTLVGRRHGTVVRALAGAAAWVATEWLVPRLLDDTLGHGLFPSYVLRQIADLGGAAGITFLLILVNECIAEAIARRGDGARALRRPILLAGCVLALMTGYGAARLSTLTAAPADTTPSLRVGMVQSNIVAYERLRREMGAYAVVRHVLDTHYAMSREAVDRHRVDALLWSETVYPTTFGHPKNEAGDELDREVLGFVDAAGVPLVFGTYDRDDAGEYNAAAFVQPSTGLTGFYRKTHPFPLTEYVPAWLDGPVFRRWLPWTGTWRPGNGARVFPLRLADGREIPVLPMICLDDVDSDLAIEGARLGAQVILGMSNDSWFTGHPVGAELHLTVAAFRSIETRLPQMRVTANGVSAVIDATGTVVAGTAMDEQKLLIGEVTPREAQATLMVRWGDWVGRTAFALLLLFAAFSAVAAWTRRTRAAVARRASSAGAGTGLRIACVVLTPFWRATAGLLQLAACAGLSWIGATLLLRDAAQTNALTQIGMFAGLVLAPLAARGSILRACAATMHLENGWLVLEQRQRRIEIRARDIRAIEPWRLPLPGPGVWLRLTADRRWRHGLASVDPIVLAHALADEGDTRVDTRSARAAAYTHACLAATHGWLDHPVVKFVLFPLVPGLPAFRLHQHIAYGGTFGEYYTFGLKAYLIALAIWWASWAIGLALFAAVLRAAIEAGTLAVVASRPAHATVARIQLLRCGRALYYVGVPLWLWMRVMAG